MTGDDRWAQGCCLSQLLRSPASKVQQPLDVLAGGYKQGFDVHLFEPPEAEPPHPVPIFGLAKERFDPHLALSQGFLV